MQRRIPLVLLVFLPLLIIFVSAGCGNGGGIVAEVNGRPILEEEFNRHFQQDQKKLLSEGITLTPAITVELRRKAMQNLIFKELLMQEFEARKLEIKEEDIEQGFQEIVALFESEEMFESELKKRGLSRALIRKEIEEVQAIQALLRNILDREIKDDAVNFLFEEYMKELRGGGDETGPFDDEGPTEIGENSNGQDPDGTGDLDEEQIKLLLRSKLEQEFGKALLVNFFNELYQKAEITILINL